MNKLTMVVGTVVLTGIAVFVWSQFQSSDNDNVSTGPSTVSPEVGGPIVRVAIPSQFSSLAQLGEVAFISKCAECHGENATGLEGSAPPLVHKIYEPSHHGDTSFYLAVQNGVRAHHWPFGNMPPVEGLTRGDVKGIVAYVRELQRENGIH